MRLFRELTRILKDHCLWVTMKLREYRSALRNLPDCRHSRSPRNFPWRPQLLILSATGNLPIKHTQKPVKVEIDSDSVDPIVFMDKGDLFRMTRNYSAMPWLTEREKWSGRYSLCRKRILRDFADLFSGETRCRNPLCHRHQPYTTSQETG